MPIYLVIFYEFLNLYLSSETMIIIYCDFDNESVSSFLRFSITLAISYDLYCDVQGLEVMNAKTV